mmetsp:Transcript_104114/g.299273  ORF Transcript_104114/g.299273 Transcript_104114/m.299273 type:complete len:440 (-) Transcript_104114:158-1477(-)
MLRASGGEAIDEGAAVAATAATAAPLGACVEAAARAVVDDAKDAQTPTRTFSFQERQSGQLASTAQVSPLAIGVQTFGRVLLRLPSKHLAVEELLQTLVAIVYQKLLEAVGSENLESVQIQEAQSTATRALRRWRDSLHHAPSEPSEQRRVKFLCESRAHRGDLPLAPLAVDLFASTNAHRHLGLQKEGPQLLLLDAQHRRRRLRRRRAVGTRPNLGGFVCEHGRSRNEAADLDDLGEARARADEPLHDAREPLQALLGARPVAAGQPRRGLQQAAALREELGPLLALRQPRPKGPGRHLPAGHRKNGGTQQVENVIGPFALRQVTGDSGGLQHVRAQSGTHHLAVCGQVHLDELAEARGVRVLPGVRVPEGLQHGRAPQQALTDVVRGGVTHGEELQNPLGGLRLPRAALARDQNRMLRTLGRQGRGDRGVKMRGARR